MRLFSLLVSSLVLVNASAFAGEADVVGVDIAETGQGRYQFNVTVLHADDGWEHYADKWDVLDEEGVVLGTRVLAHPHDNEQPFTRSATINIPEGVTHVTVRAHDLVHGYGGKEMQVELP